MYSSFGSAAPLFGCTTSVPFLTCNVQTHLQTSSRVNFPKYLQLPTVISGMRKARFSKQPNSLSLSLSPVFFYVTCLTCIRVRSLITTKKEKRVRRMPADFRVEQHPQHGCTYNVYTYLHPPVVYVYVYARTADNAECFPFFPPASPAPRWRG